MWKKTNGNPQVKLHNTNRILIQEDIHTCKSERLNKKKLKDNIVEYFLD